MSDNSGLGLLGGDFGLEHINFVFFLANTKKSIHLREAGSVSTC